MEKLNLSDTISCYIYGEAVGIEFADWIQDTEYGKVNKRFFGTYAKILARIKSLRLSDGEDVIARLKDAYEKYIAKNEPTDELFTEYECQLHKGVVAMATSNQTVIDDLFNCGTFGARFLLSQNPNITDDLFIKLAQPDMLELNFELYENPKLSSDKLQIAVFGDGSYIGARFIARRTDLSQSVVNQIADKIAFNFESDGLFGDGCNDFFQRYQVDGDILEHILKSQKTKELSFLAICKYQNLNEQLLMGLIKENRYNCRKVLASRTDLPKNVFESLLANSDDIKAELAGNPCTPDEKVVEFLQDDTDSSVAYAVAKRKNIPESAYVYFEKIDYSSSVFVVLFDRDDLPENALDIFVKSKNPIVRGNLTSYKKLPSKYIELLSLDNDPWVRERLSARQDLTDIVKANIEKQD